MTAASTEIALRFSDASVSSSPFAHSPVESMAHPFFTHLVPRLGIIIPELPEKEKEKSPSFSFASSNLRLRRAESRPLFSCFHLLLFFLLLRLLATKGPFGETTS